MTESPDRYHQPENIEKNEKELKTTLKKISESAMFHPEYLRKRTYVLFQSKKNEKPPVFENETWNESKEIYSPEDFEKGLRTDFIGLTDIDTYNTFNLEDPRQFSDRQYIQLLFYDKKFPYDEFVAHETGHNVFDLAYTDTYGEFNTYEIRNKQGEVMGIETDCSAEYILKITEKIGALLQKHDIRVDLERFQINRQKIAEIFALMIQREYARRVNNPYQDHQNLEKKVQEFLSHSQALMNNVNEKTGRTITLLDFYAENHILSFIVVPCLEKEYRESIKRLEFFELMTRKYMREQLELTIKHATPEDLPNILELTKEAYKHPFKPDMLTTTPHESANIQEQVKNKELYILTAEHEGIIIGAVRYHITKDNNLYFEKLVTLPKFRNKNVGSSLLRQLETIAKTNGYQKILLDCAQEKGLPEYYKKHGYAIDDIRKHHNHHDVFMSKKYTITIEHAKNQ